MERRQRQLHVAWIATCATLPLAPRVPRHGDLDGTFGACTAVSGLEVPEVSEVSEDLPCGRRKPAPLSVGAIAECRRITLLFAASADARQAIESTPLLNFAIFAGHFVPISFLITLALPRAERASARPAVVDRINDA